MKMFRIQKILLAEYQEIYEPVLVESPFAEVTEDGIGIRQLQLGLTPTKIIIGQDLFEKSNTCFFTKVALVDKDPEIECFELVSVLPLDALKVTFYKKGKRVIMNVVILNEKTVLFEFGGHISQNLYWNTWRERIATLRHMGANLFNISGSSPFSSTDVIPEEEEITVSIHPSPRKINPFSDCESITDLQPKRDIYKRIPEMQTDQIEKALSSDMSTASYHRMELQNYFRSLSVTNSFSCGCNTSW